MVTVDVLEEKRGTSANSNLPNLLAADIFILNPFFHRVDVSVLVFDDGSISRLTCKVPDRIGANAQNSRFSESESNLAGAFPYVRDAVSYVYNYGILRERFMLSNRERINRDIKIFCTMKLFISQFKGTV
jgi:hypothetical protein